MRQAGGRSLVDGERDARYLRIRGPRGGFAVRASSSELLERVDAVVFDCDGVLIDARKSYDETIRLVVEQMVKEVTGVKLTLATSVPRLISTVRRTGGFNNDWDTTYALTLFSLVALKEGGGRRGAAVDSLARVTEGFGSAPRERGKPAADSYLDERFPRLRGYLDQARDHLGYPEMPPEGRMTSLFDEVYFGASIFQKFHGFPPSGRRRKGLIELERVLVSTKTLDCLSSGLGQARLAVVTGRPRLGTELSLGDRVMGHLNLEASMFIGDADANSSRTEFQAYRKPSPDALIRAKEKLSSETLLYVGDSAEDLMMVQNARRRGLEGYLFAGVCETSPVKAEQASFFERESSDLVLATVNQVPSGLFPPPGGEEARA